MHRGVLLDTSFFIRLLDKNDPLHNNAKEYYKYFLDYNYEMCISTISVAEYCVGDALVISFVPFLLLSRCMLYNE
jgi:predicted nucleic acid-binding protein